MTQFMLIDGNSVGYANQHSHTLTSQGMEVQAIIGTLRSVRKRLVEFPSHFPVLMWDGRAQWRYDLYPDYKASRLKSESSRAARASYDKQQPALRTMAQKLGLTQLCARAAEADDVGYQLMTALVDLGHEVLFLTSDTDALVGLRPGVSWLDPRTDRRITTMEELAAYKGTPDPRAYLEAKALEGDTSDTIPGVKRVGIPTALKVFERYGGSMATFYEQVAAGRVDLKKKTLSSLASEEGRAIFARNMRLMDLAAAPPLSSTDIEVTSEPLDSVVFCDWAEHFAFQAVLQNVGVFLAPFEAAESLPGRDDLHRAMANLLPNEAHQEVVV
jgi:DNA polymerase-1